MKRIKEKTILIATMAALPAMAQNSSAMSDSTLLTILLVMIVFQIFLLFGISSVFKGLSSNSSIWLKKFNKEAAAGVAVIGTLLLTTPAYAADGGSTYTIDSGLEQLLVAVNAFLLIMNVLMLWNLKSMVNVLRGPEAENVEPWWSQMYTKLVGSVPVEEESDILMDDHSYDGIQELDNDLPPWWKYGFYITIGIAAVYFYYYEIHLGGNISEQEYNTEMAEAQAAVDAYLASSANNVDENTVTLLTGAGDLAKGAEIFKANCVACHLDKGQGQVGPNLTDDYWIHGGDIKSVFSTIKYGVLAKGMTAWDGVLTPRQMQEVASYVESLPYVAPPEGKAPEGTLEAESAEPEANEEPAAEEVIAAN